MKIAYVIPLTFFLAGCASAFEPVQSAIDNSKNDAQKRGYQHGCMSGKRAGGALTSEFMKENTSDKDYLDAWQDAFAVCKGDQENWNKIIRGY